MIDKINGEPTFPDVTVCNLNPFVSLHDEEISINDYAWFVRQNISKTDIENITGLNLREEDFVEMAGKMESVPGFHQNSQPTTVNKSHPSTSVPFILSCKWYDWMWGEITHRDITHNCSGSVEAFRSPDYVLCYTIKVPETVLSPAQATDVRGLTLVLYLNENTDGHIPRFHPNLGFSIAAGARVSIHAPGTMPDNNKGISVSPGHETTIRLQRTQHERLGKPYGACENDQNLTRPSGGSVRYSQSACMGLCFQDQIIQNCSCIDVLLQHTQEDLEEFDYCGKIPNLTQLINTYRREDALEDEETENHLLNDDSFRSSMYAVGRKLACANSYEANVTKCQEKCLHPCHEESYSFRVTQAPWPHKAYSLALFEKLSKDNPTLEQYFQLLSKLVSKWKELGHQVLETANMNGENQQADSEGTEKPTVGEEVKWQTSRPPSLLRLDPSSGQDDWQNYSTDYNVTQHQTRKEYARNGNQTRVKNARNGNQTKLENARNGNQTKLENVRNGNQNRSENNAQNQQRDRNWTGEAENIGAARMIKTNFLEVKILFDEATSIKVEEKQKVTIASALGNVGGILNLWIGISFMTLVELFELCIKAMSAWRQQRVSEGVGTMDETQMTKLPKT